MILQVNPSTYLVILISVVSVLTLFFSYNFENPSKQKVIIIIIRFLILILLIILLFDPVVEKKGNNEKSMRWHVYIDKSLSTKYHKQPSILAYKEGIQTFLNEIKEKK